jgi:hypothetical protein
LEDHRREDTKIYLSGIGCETVDWTGFNCLRMISMVGFHEHDNENSDSIKSRQFLQLSAFQETPCTMELKVIPTYIQQLH